MSDEDQEIDQDPGEVGWRSLSILPCTSKLERTDPEHANILYERAITKNAGSYKLWHAYLLHRTKQTDKKSPSDQIYEEVNFCYERALVFMHKMPRIWIEYCDFLKKQPFITRTRRTFNRALEALPITQHSRIWGSYLDFVTNEDYHVPTETAVRVFKRYLQLHPENVEQFIDYLVINDRIDEASKLLCEAINRPHFQSKKNKSKYELWEDLCSLICEHADQITSVDAEAVLRDGISRYSDQQGRLWNALAVYFIRLGMFANARNVYDEAIHSVMTKGDFEEVWHAYRKFEYKYLEHLLEKQELNHEELLEVEIRQTFYEDLNASCGLLSNRVALRQNPHNVHEWEKRVKLCDTDEMKGETFIEATETVDPKQAIGNYENLWIMYAMYHNDAGRIQKARDVFERAVMKKFAKTDDLARVWCAYVEFELRQNSGRALRTVKRAVSDIKNIHLWSLYADLEENFGNFGSAKAVYEKILDLKIATPQLVLNYAFFLEEEQYYEESFRIYERGVSLFRWPASYNIWKTYLDKFLSRYSGKKLDRARDLLEQCLKDCPSDLSFEFYLLYAKIEEDNGLVSRAQAVYSRAAQNVESKRKADLYTIYIRSMTKMLDINKVRKIYEEAIATLSNEKSRAFCLEYASLEEEFGEIARARTIYSYCSQMCNPKVDKEFWKMWADFEQKYGGLETINEMLRLKRSTFW